MSAYHQMFAAFPHTVGAARHPSGLSVHPGFMAAPGLARVRDPKFRGMGTASWSNRFHNAPGLGLSEAGTSDSLLMAAANAVIALANPCQCDLTGAVCNSTVAKFQAAWNVTSDTDIQALNIQLTVDGKYGANTASALGQAVATGTNVPAPCSAYIPAGGGGVTPPSPTPPSPGPSPSPSPSPSPAPSTSGSNTGLIVGAVVAALALGGAVAYAQKKKKGGGKRRKH